MAEPEVDAALWPLTEAELHAVSRLRAQLGALEDQTGGWSVKTDNRQTGLSLYVKFDRKVDIAATLMFAELLVEAPTKLYALCTRLLAASGVEVDVDG